MYYASHHVFLIATAGVLAVLLSRFGISLAEFDEHIPHTKPYGGHGGRRSHGYF